MSDPVTNVEIEDVLSSIRRLVSEESRTEARAERPESARKADKLVLTPALRVAVPSEDVASAPGPASSEQSSPEPVITELDAEAPWSNPDATLFEAAQVAGGAVDRSATQAEDVAKPMILQPEEAVEGTAELAPQEKAQDFDADGLEAPQGEYVDEGEDAVEHDEDEHDEAHDSAEQTSASEWGADQDEVGSDLDPEGLSVEVAEEMPELQTSWGDIQSTVEAAETASLGAKIEALEAVIAQVPEQWEPDGEGTDDYAGTSVETMEWQDHVPDIEPEREIEALPISDPMPETDGAGDVRERHEEAAPEHVSESTDAFEDEQALLTPDETILDEESLRELVADIVRQELQGALGERITRNVRKLVRREIHRALTAQELE